MVRVVVTVAVLFSCSLKMLGGSIRAEDTFQARVVPILERRCVGCHNDQQREGDFSLQSAKAAFADGYIKPGDAAGSSLLALITPENGQAEMPKDATPLSDEEVKLIRDWIQGGANWPSGVRLDAATVGDFDWWSYAPLKSPPVPQQRSTWAKTAIDDFVLAKLNENGLAPSKPADRQTLIRRLTYDLTGLPPTPEQVDAFVSDPDPNAYEKVVDRLLESDRYGEHWARHWLDVAKYADSCGYDKDKLRPNAWPYRDYVIRSLNCDKPYSRFVQEQIAGDVLFPDDPDGIIGLGFVAAGPWDFIGHVEVSEAKIDGKVARNLDRDDMVSGVFNTFCSLTVQCARCHNHKFDPITQENYYGLQAVFAAVDRADRKYDVHPQTANRRRELASRLAELNAARRALESEIEIAGGKELADANVAVVDLEKGLRPLRPPEHGYHSQIAANPDIQKWVEIELPRNTTVERIVLHPCSDDFNGIGDGFGFPVRFKIETIDSSGSRTLIRDETARDFANPGIGKLAIDVPRQEAARVRVTATKLAMRSGDYIFALAELRVFAGGKNVAANATVVAADSIEVPIRWGRQNLVDGKWPSLGEPDVIERLAAAKAKRDSLYEALASEPSSHSADSRYDQIQSYSSKIAAVEAALSSLPARASVYAAATDFPANGNFRPTGGTPRDVFVLGRGEVTMPGKLAVPGVLPLSPGLPWQFASELNEGQRRKKLAEWLVDRDNPFVWRSIVNRVWQYHFGEGIVATPNDFGRMGALPTHPELLDWLAVEFRDGGQSLKKLHRMIVTSNTYQQSSAHHAKKAAIDGGNRFLWRANRRRLSAEELRDSILTVSGAMNLEMGGPGYYLFELEKTEHSPHFEYHKFDPKNKASHRRSIYRFVARSQPNPYMTTLDCADSSQSTPRRNETLTSLQALALLNNKFSLVMAEEFAARLKRDSADLEAQVRQALELVTQRTASETEVQELSAYAKTHGMANMCRLLFNLSEFVFVD